MLTQGQVAHYHEKGYLAIENVFSAAEMELLQQITDEFVERSRTAEEDNADTGVSITKRCL